MDTPYQILLLGKAGSGKGTQANKLKNNINIPFFSFGEILKEEVKNKTKAGVVLEQHIKQGTFASDYLATDIFFSKFLSQNLEKGWIIEGFPRTTLQIQIFEEKCPSITKKMKVFYLEISDEIATKRILSRTTCQNCYSVYNAYSNTPKIDGYCDYCQSKLIHREDDNKEVIKTRLQIFSEKSLPVVEYYKKQGNLFTIDAFQPIEKVYNLILDILQK